MSGIRRASISTGYGQVVVCGGHALQTPGMLESNYLFRLFSLNLNAVLKAVTRTDKGCAEVKFTYILSVK